MIDSAKVHSLVYSTLTHPRFANVIKIIGAILVCATSYWYFENFDKIMGTEEGKKQIEREKEALRDEKLRELADEGDWLMSQIPDLPPIPFDPSKDWKAFAKTKTPSHTSQQSNQPNNTPRVEKGKSGDFEEGLLVINNLRLDSGAGQTGEGMDTPHIHALLSNTGSNYLDDARVDISFLDAEGNVLLRRSINPLVVSGGLFGDKIKPLFPGETRKIMVDASQVPSGWIDKLRAEVVYYRLAP